MSLISTHSHELTAPENTFKVKGQHQTHEQLLRVTLLNDKTKFEKWPEVIQEKINGLAVK